MEIRSQKRHFLVATTCFVTGLSFGYILWGFAGNFRTPGIGLEEKFRFIWDYSVNQTKPQGTILPRYPPDALIEELTILLQQKRKAITDSKYVVKSGKHRYCTNHEHRGSICVEKNCTGSLPPVMSPENIKSVLKPLEAVGRDKLREVINSFNLKPERKKYIFITATSSNHFNESQAAVQSLHQKVLPHLTNYSFYYYDLGLKEEERQLIRDYSGAELRSFPFDKLPDHFRHLKCYTWKPLVILAHLEHAEYVLWMDASTFYTQDIRPYFDMAATTGFILNTNGLAMVEHTVLSMFDYFGDKPCLFTTYRELEAGTMVFHNEPFIRRLIVEPWGACAVDPKCMCPEQSKKMLRCEPNIRKYGKCHRYEQTTIGYLAIKLYRDIRPSVLISKFLHQARRDQRGYYFYDLKKKQNAKNPKVKNETSH